MNVTSLPLELLCIMELYTHPFSWATTWPSLAYWLHFLQQWGWGGGGVNEYRLANLNPKECNNARNKKQ